MQENINVMVKLKNETGPAWGGWGVMLAQFLVNVGDLAKEASDPKEGKSLEDSFRLQDYLAAYYNDLYWT